MFRFKQFSVDQTGCAMKINTDGVLLGALAAAEDLMSILDIGTGTGVIALMLAQRYPQAKIDAVEIDETAASTAGNNFKSSPFAGRLSIYPSSFESYFQQFPARKYDLIVSNPPFYLNSLKSPHMEKAVAKHTDVAFFERLMLCCAVHLNDLATVCLILTTNAATLVKNLKSEHSLHLQRVIKISSFQGAEHQREILFFSKSKTSLREDDFVIYDASKVYSATYQILLNDFLTVF